MQPPLTPAAPDEPLYEAFYGLREQPFALTTDPRFLFMGDAHRRAYDELLTGLRRREGLLLLTGDTGMGKTTLCRAVIEAVGPRTFSALILNPYMSDAEVLRVILRDFGLVTRDEIRKGAFAKADVPQLLDTLEGFLHSLVALNSYAVVIIDEAQSLSTRVLDQIRVLGGYEHEGQRLLQIILVGQPELLSTIRTDAMRALEARVTRRAVLGPLPPADVDAYIQHRLTVAGGKDTLDFTAESVNLIAELTRGVPRRINMLCDRTLEAGRVEGTNTITPAIVQRAHQVASGQPLPSAVLQRIPAAPPVAAALAPVPGPASHSAAFDEMTLDLDEGLALTHAETDTPRHEHASPDDARLMFGQTAPEPQVRRRAGLWQVLAWVMVTASIGTAAAYFSWEYINSRTQVVMPMLPATPPREMGPLPGPFPIPSNDADEKFLMNELQRLNPGWTPPQADGRGGGGY